jgi:aspartate aminotransferase-like enzyme
MCGAFSDKWFDVALKCGKAADKLQVEWGQPILPDALRERLATGEFDTVTLIHNETSTGTMSPLADLCAVVREFPEVCLVVDSVSSFSVVPTPFDELGIDVLLTGSQKALAMPPGLALFALSQKALDRAASVKGRGYYFDFLEFVKNGESNMTPSTPCIPHLYALESKLEDIAAEGIAQRYARHAANNALVHAWGARHGLSLLPDPAFASRSLTCFKNVHDWDLPALNKKLRERHSMVIDGGYGKIKGLTFRISNMGDETAETMTELLNALDDCLAG